MDTNTIIVLMRVTPRGYRHVPIPVASIRAVEAVRVGADVLVTCDDGRTGWVDGGDLAFARPDLLVPQGPVSARGGA